MPAMPAGPDWACSRPSLRPLGVSESRALPRCGSLARRKISASRQPANGRPASMGSRPKTRQATEDSDSSAEKVKRPPRPAGRRAGGGHDCPVNRTARGPFARDPKIIIIGGIQGVVLITPRLRPVLLQIAAGHGRQGLRAGGGRASTPPPRSRRSALAALGLASAASAACAKTCGPISYSQQWQGLVGKYRIQMLERKREIERGWVGGREGGRMDGWREE